MAVNVRHPSERDTKTAYVYYNTKIGVEFLTRSTKTIILPISFVVVVVCLFVCFFNPVLLKITSIFVSVPESLAAAAVTCVGCDLFWERSAALFSFKRERLVLRLPPPPPPPPPSSSLSLCARKDKAALLLLIYGVYMHEPLISPKESGTVFTGAKLLTGSIISNVTRC